MIAIEQDIIQNLTQQHSQFQQELIATIQLDE